MSFIPMSGRTVGRVLLGHALTPDRTNTNWNSFSFGGTVYDDSANYTCALDDKFAHIANGSLVVDTPIPKAYISGWAARGITSSGTATYCGIRFLKNGTVIEGTSIYGSSSVNSPSFRKVVTSFAKGDVITLQTRVSSTTQGYCRASCTITMDC